MSNRVTRSVVSTLFHDAPSPQGGRDAATPGQQVPFDLPRRNPPPLRRRNGRLALGAAAAGRDGDMPVASRADEAAPARLVVPPPATRRALRRVPALPDLRAPQREDGGHAAAPGAPSPDEAQQLATDMRGPQRRMAGQGNDTPFASGTSPGTLPPAASDAARHTPRRPPAGFLSMPAEVHLNVARRLDDGALLAMRGALHALPPLGDNVRPRPLLMRRAASVYDSDAFLRRDLAGIVERPASRGAIRRFHEAFVPRAPTASDGVPAAPPAPARGGRTHALAAAAIETLALAPAFAADPRTMGRDIDMLTDAVSQLEARRRGAPLIAIATGLAKGGGPAPAWPHVERLCRLAADMPASGPRSEALVALMGLLPRIAGSTAGDRWNRLADHVRGLDPPDRRAAWQHLLLTAIDPRTSSERHALWPHLQARLSPADVPANLTTLEGLPPADLAALMQHLVLPPGTSPPGWTPAEPQLQALFERVAAHLIHEVRLLLDAPEGAHAEFPVLPVGASWPMVENSPAFAQPLRTMVADMVFMALTDAFTAHVDSAVLRERVAVLTLLCQETVPDSSRPVAGHEGAWLDAQTIRGMDGRLTPHALPGVLTLLDAVDPPPPGTIAALSEGLERMPVGRGDADQHATNIASLVGRVGRVAAPAERQAALAALTRAALTASGLSAMGLWERLAVETHQALPASLQAAVWAPLMRLAMPSASRDPVASLPGVLRPHVSALNMPPLDVLARLDAAALSLRLRPVVQHAIASMDEAMPSPGLDSIVEPVLAQVVASVHDFPMSAVPGHPGPPQTVAHLVEATRLAVGSAPMYLQAQQRVGRLLAHIAANGTRSREQWILRHVAEMRMVPSLLRCPRLFHDMLNVAGRLPTAEQAGIYRMLDGAIEVPGPDPLVRDMRAVLFRSIDRQRDQAVRDRRLVCLAERAASRPSAFRPHTLAMLLQRGPQMGSMAGQDMLRALAIPLLDHRFDAPREAAVAQQGEAFHADLVAALAVDEGRGIRASIALARLALQAHPLALSRWIAATAQAVQAPEIASSRREEVMPELAANLSLLANEPAALHRALSQLLHAPDAIRMDRALASIAPQVVDLLGATCRPSRHGATSGAVLDQVVGATDKLSAADRVNRLSGFARLVRQAEDLPGPARAEALQHLFNAVARRFTEEQAAAFFRGLEA